MNCKPASEPFASLTYPVVRLSWSPDQNHMAFLSKGYGLGLKLYIWDAGCLAEKVPDCKLQKDQLKEIVLRKTIIFDDSEPIWSTDGRYLMFAVIIYGQSGFYRVPSNCYDDADGCKPELLLDFDNITQARIQ